MRKRLYRIGSVQYLVHDDWQFFRMIFPDGAEKCWTSNYTPDDLARAQAHGYGDDTALMSAQHEAVHAYLADLLGLPHSPSLWAAAHPEQPIGQREADLEEWLCMQFQRLVRTGQADPQALVPLVRAGYNLEHVAASFRQLWEEGFVLLPEEHNA